MIPENASGFTCYCEFHINDATTNSRIDNYQLQMIAITINIIDNLTHIIYYISLTL